MPRHDSSPPSAAAAAPHWSAIVVAGGRARRLGGIDKTALVWQGRSLLDGVLAAASGARRICVVGSDAPLPAQVLRTVERPRWGGPAAAIAAGLTTLATEPGVGAVEEPDWVLVLAGDLVHADAAVALLFAELTRVTAADLTVDGLISVDSAGRRQPLLAVYRRAALVASAGRQPADNLSVMSLIGRLTLEEVHLPNALGEDVDTPADAARLGIVVPTAAASPRTPRSER